MYLRSLTHNAQPGRQTDTFLRIARVITCINALHVFASIDLGDDPQRFGSAIPKRTLWIAGRYLHTSTTSIGNRKPYAVKRNTKDNKTTNLGTESSYTVTLPLEM